MGTFLSDQIKERIEMQELVRFYGYEPSRSGFLRCPFHADGTASLKIYDNGKGWYCFGCHKGGTVIDFVMEDFGLSFSDACRKINTDFALGLTGSRPSKSDKALAILRRNKAVQKMRKQRDYELTVAMMELEEQNGNF